MIKFKLKKPIPLPKLDLTKKKQGFFILLIGIVVALIIGALASVYTWPTNWIWVVLAMGVVVGVLNIFHEEGVLFLIALLTITVMLNLVGGMSLFPVWATTLFNAVIYLLAPVAILVSLKVLYALAAE